MDRRGFLVGAGALAGCGYKVGGKANLMPADVKTIGIPPFTNPTTRYKLTEKLPTAIGREFLARTKYQILPDANGADAVLAGNVATLIVFPITGNAVQAQVLLSVTLTATKTGAVIYTNPSMDFRQRYEIAQDPLAYFDESNAAFDRLCRDVAASVVTAVLENF
jgi:hypothetical protein